MNVLSVFDGISCGRVALERANIPVTNYFSSEIKESALVVANYNHPHDTVNRLGDIRSIKAASLPNIDLLLGGSPCQDFSIANKERQGLAGSKSSLFFEYIRLLRETKPTYFLLENVRMKLDQQNIISEALGVEPVVINSSLVSPALRHRLYWTNIPNITSPLEISIELRDILSCGYTDRTKARCVMEGDSRPLSTPWRIAHRYFNTGFTTVVFKNERHFSYCKSICNTLKQLSLEERVHFADTHDLREMNGVRYLNQEELELCQTLPIGYTKCLNRDHAAGVIGDGWTVDVIAHILKGINL